MRKMITRRVEIVEANAHWPLFFQQAAQHIRGNLGLHLKSLQHFGSTSIPLMPAKPVLDILIELADLDDIQAIEKIFLHMGYEKLHRSIIPFRSYFTYKLAEPFRIHCHLYEVGDPQVARHLRFRDYLIQYPDEALAYATLKKTLATQYEYDIYQYVAGKDNFVRLIDARAKRWSKKANLANIVLAQNPGKNHHAWSAEKLNQAVEANVNIYLTHFLQYTPTANFVRSPGVVIAENNVLDAHFAEQVAEAEIAKIIHYFSTKQLPFTWWVGNTDQPSTLGEKLIHAGFDNAEAFYGKIIDLDTWEYPLENHSVEISQRDCYAELRTSEDPIEFYAGGALVLYAQVAVIYNYPEDALQSYLLQRAKQAGYHVAVVQTIEPTAIK